MQVKWLDKPELQVEKNADKSGKTYKLGDIITYTLDVTQQIEKAIAKNVVITDTILTEGVKLQKNSVILLNENGEKIPDAKITVQGNSYTIHAGEFLEGPESGQKYTVEYQVAITDESVIGKEIENEVVVCSENAEEVKDRETVKVEEEPKPEPGEPKVEEPTPGRSRGAESGGAESGRTESRRTADTCYTGSYIGEIIKSINCENGRCSKYNRNYPNTDSFLHRDCAVWYNERMAKS